MNGHGQDAKAPVPSTDVAERASRPLTVRTAGPVILARLNLRGFRLVQLADAALLLGIMIGTMLVRDGWAWPTYPKPLYALSFGVTLAIFMASLYFGGLYEREARLGQPPVLPRAARQTLGAGGLVALINLIATGLAERLGYETERALPMPILNLVVLIVLGAVAIPINRRLVSWMQSNREGPSRVLLVGAPDDLNVAISHLRGDADRAVVVASAWDVDGLLDTVDQNRVTDVMLLSSRWLDSMYPDVLEALDERDVSVLQRVTARETMFGLERIRQVGGMPFVALRAHTIASSRARFKRFTDLILLMAMLPALVVAIGVLATFQLVVVGRPVLFLQERVGERGRTFQMVKFRTMYPTAEEDGNPRLATQDDPRIIPACRWMRATRMDELPQIWNILRGEMSLVGPRPERPELTAQFSELIPGYVRRHELPPGLTGLAQIHGRYHTDPEYKLGYDLQYLVNWSPILDLEILIRTVWVIIARRI